KDNTILCIKFQCTIKNDILKQTDPTYQNQEKDIFQQFNNFPIDLTVLSLPYILHPHYRTKTSV
ncbi:MAG TPA: hypothetical protein PKK34_01570, partial [Syntrophorhabdaceae bacterium]|nr:hypothetical protein [Syntrophorhabdaceae bacterium]